MRFSYIALMMILGVVLVGAGCASEPTATVPEENDVVAETENNTEITGPATSSPSDTTTIDPVSLTVAEVAKHASAEDCYTIVRDEVYNLTEWIAKHPGGSQAILKLCGVDGTAAFERMHGGKEKQENILAGYKVGDLAR